MKKIVILLITLFILCVTTPIFSGPFSDVKPDNWAYKAVKEFSSKGKLKGYPNNYLNDNNKITRYEMAQMTARLLEIYGLGENHSPLQKLTIEFADELALLGIKVTVLDDETRAIRMDQEDMKAKLDHMGMGKIWSGTETRVRFERKEVNEPLTRFKLNLSSIIDENTSAYYSYGDGSSYQVKSPKKEIIKNSVKDGSGEVEISE